MPLDDEDRDSIDRWSVRQIADLVDEHEAFVLAILDLQNADTLEGITSAYHRVVDHAAGLAQKRFDYAVQKLKYEAISEGHKLRISAQGGLV